MSGVPFRPRPLTDLESAVVTTLLSAGADELRAQMPYSEVVATWGVGSPSVDLVVRSGVTQAAVPGDGIFANGAVTDGNGAPIGELILWADNAWLSAIELAWCTDVGQRPVLGFVAARSSTSRPAVL